MILVFRSVTSVSVLLPLCPMNFLNLSGQWVNSATPHHGLATVGVGARKIEYAGITSTPYC